MSIFGPILSLPLGIVAAALAAFLGFEGEAGSAEWRSDPGAQSVTGSIDFSVTVIDSSQVAINDLGHGVYETTVASRLVNERHITASAPTHFWLSAEEFKLHPEGIRFALE